MSRKYTKKQKEILARKLHELLSYQSIVILHTSEMIMRQNLDENKRQEEIEILSNIEMTAQQVYDDLDDEQRRYLRKLAANILNEL